MAAEDFLRHTKSRRSQSSRRSSRKKKVQSSHASEELTVATSGRSASGLVVGKSGKSVSAATMRKAFQSLGKDEGTGGIELEDVIVAMNHKKPPSPPHQLWIVTKRAAMKRFRDFYPTTVIDIALLLAAACIVGVIHGTSWKQAQAPSHAVMAMTTLATLTSVTFLRTLTKVRLPRSHPCLDHVLALL